METYTEWPILHGLNTMGLFQSLCNSFIISSSPPNHFSFELRQAVFLPSRNNTGVSVWCTVISVCPCRDLNLQLGNLSLSGIVWDGLQVGSVWNSMFFEHSSSNSSLSVIIIAAGTTSLHCLRKPKVICCVLSLYVCNTVYIFSNRQCDLKGPLPLCE